jgi:hypothetical protein
MSRCQVVWHGHHIKWVWSSMMLVEHEGQKEEYILELYRGTCFPVSFIKSGGNSYGLLLENNTDDDDDEVEETFDKKRHCLQGCSLLSSSRYGQSTNNLNAHGEFEKEEDLEVLEMEPL